MMVHDLLGRLKWKRELKECEITIRHRGAPNNKKEISGIQVTEIKKSHFFYRNDRETFIPYHRVLEIRVKGKTVWKRHGKE